MLPYVFYAIASMPRLCRPTHSVRLCCASSPLAWTAPSLRSRSSQNQCVMDARGTVAVLTVAPWVADANVAALPELAQMRRALLRAQAAAFAGQRSQALLLLQGAARQQPPVLPQRGVQTRAHVRGVACRALALCISEANAAAVAEVASLRRAALDAHALVLRGDCGLAERVLANALGYQPPLVPHPRPQTRCSMCDRQVRYVTERLSTEDWPDLPARFRELCDPCYDMQPPDPAMQL